MSISFEDVLRFDVLRQALAPIFQVVCVALLAFVQRRMNVLAWAGD
jgi:hypothetical protein